MSVAPEPVEPTPQGTPDISEAAQLARERLHEEIERVRSGVEEMLDEQESNGNGNGSAAGAEDIREELERLRLETKDYVKRKVRKSEKKLERSVREIDARTGELEQRIDQVEADREEAEWRIHNDTEQMLDGLLEDVRAIADRLAEQPAPQPRAVASPRPTATNPLPAATPLGAPVGRVGRRPLGRRA